MPTSTAGLPSVSGPPLSPWQVAELAPLAHSRTADSEPTSSRHASLPTAVSWVEYSRQLGSPRRAPFCLPKPLMLSGVPGDGVCPVGTSEIALAVGA